jgi:hypothetical protein
MRVTSALLLHRNGVHGLLLQTMGTGADASFGGGPMELSRDTGRFARSRPVIECAQCGDRLYVPEWTEYRDGGRVRHLWACDACGYAFETFVRFAAAA